MKEKSHQSDLRNKLIRFDKEGLKLLNRANRAYVAQIITAPLFMLMAVLVRFHSDNGLYITITLAVGIPVFLSFLVLDRQTQDELTNIRNQRASLIIPAIESGLTPCYSVYVRPFQTDGKVKESHTSQWGHVEQDLEKAFANALEPIAPLVGLSRDRESWGVGRLITDENWQKIFEMLLENAFCIIAIPYPTPSTKIELKVIMASVHRLRTVCVVPARDKNWPKKSDWENVRGELTRIGLDRALNHRNNLGYIFSIGGSGQRVATALLPTIGWRGLRKDIMRLINKEA